MASEVTICTTAATDSITSAPCASRDQRDAVRRRVVDDERGGQGLSDHAEHRHEGGQQGGRRDDDGRDDGLGRDDEGGVAPSQIPPSTRSATTARTIPTGTVTSSTATGSATAKRTTLPVEKPRSLASATSWRRTSAADATRT